MSDPGGVRDGAARPAPAPNDAVRPPAVIHVDLDGAEEIFAAHGMPYPWGDDPLFESGLENALRFLDENGLRATLFTVASSLAKQTKLDLLRAAVQQGHEVASHTLSHANLRRLGHAEKQREIFESRRLLQETLGVSVNGFRAPGYHIDRESLDLLADAGYVYDSSIVPGRAIAQRVGFADGIMEAPFSIRSEPPLLELPLPQHSPSPIPWSPSYSLLVGQHYFRWGLRRVAPAGRPLVLLFHLTDFAAPLPPARQAGWKLRLFTLSIMSARTKRQRCQAMLDAVRTHFRCTTTASLLGGMRPGEQALENSTWNATH